MYLLLNFKIFPIKLIHFIYLFVCSASFYSLIRNKVFRFFDLFGNICDRLSIVMISRYGFLAIQLFFFQTFNKKQLYKFFDRSREEFLSTSADFNSSPELNKISNCSRIRAHLFGKIFTPEFWWNLSNYDQTL